MRHFRWTLLTELCKISPERIHRSHCLSKGVKTLYKSYDVKGKAYLNFPRHHSACRGLGQPSKRKAHLSSSNIKNVQGPLQTRLPHGVNQHSSINFPRWWPGPLYTLKALLRISLLLLQRIRSVCILWRGLSIMQRYMVLVELLGHTYRKQMW